MGYFKKVERKERKPTYFSSEKIQYVIRKRSILVEIFIFIRTREIRCQTVLSFNDILCDVLNKFPVVDDDLWNHNEPEDD